MHYYAPSPFTLLLLICRALLMYLFLGYAINIWEHPNGTKREWMICCVHATVTLNRIFIHPLFSFFIFFLILTITQGTAFKKHSEYYCLQLILVIQSLED